MTVLTPGQIECRNAMLAAFRAWLRNYTHQLELFALDEPHASVSPSPPGGGVLLVEPDGSSCSGAGPTPAQTRETHPHSLPGSSFRQDSTTAAAVRVPGPRHLHVAPDLKETTTTDPMEVPLWTR